MLENAGQSPANSYRIVNSLSPELQYYRQSLLPSLLSKIHANIKSGFDQFCLFEFNKVHPKDSGLTAEDVPVEHYNLALVVADKNSQQTAYYQAKRYLDLIAKQLNLELEFKPLSNSVNCRQVMFEPKRAAEVLIARQVVAWVGEFKQSVAKNFKLPAFCAGVELDFEQLFAEASQVSRFNYQPISRYPQVERDVCFEVAPDVTYGELIQPIEVFCRSLAGGQQQITWSPIDIYQASVEASKRITLHLTLTDFEATLSADDASLLVDRLLAAVAKVVKFTII